MTKITKKELIHWIVEDIENNNLSREEILTSLKKLESDLND